MSIEKTTDAREQVYCSKCSITIKKNYSVIEGNIYCFNCTSEATNLDNILETNDEKYANLYIVTLNGFKGTRYCYGKSYVIAKNAEIAYQKVKSFLEDRKLGFASALELDTIELVATEYEYTEKPILFLDE